MDRFKIFSEKRKNGAGRFFEVDRESGLIAKIGEGEPPRSADVVFDAEYEILPGDFNAHSHPEQSLYVEITDASWELAKWCRETIYKYSVLMTPERVYYSCVRAFTRMLSFGVTSVMVSFYCHGRRGNELDKAVIAAAKDVGIRLFFGRMNYDEVSETAYPEKRKSQLSYFETPDEAAANYISLKNGEEAPGVVIAPALHSFHANTLDGIVRGINLGAEYERHVQMHLSEDEGDVKIALERYGLRPVEVLDGLLESGRIKKLDHMILSDCVWTDENEKKLIKALGMSVVVDGRMNARVKAGRIDLRRYLELGIPVYVGTDGEASNDDLSVENETAWLAREFNLSQDEISLLKRPFESAGVKVGVLEDGSAADFKVVKGGALSSLYVGGRAVISDGVFAASSLADEAEEYIAKLWALEKR